MSDDSGGADRAQLLRLWEVRERQHEALGQLGRGDDVRYGPGIKVPLPWSWKGKIRQASGHPGARSR